MKTLVLGGYGNFGARIARALSGNDQIELLIGGRNVRRAQAFAAQLQNANAIAVDALQADFPDQLRQHGIELVIHTAGPFQEQGYGVAFACATAGAHYIDLADGRRFVCDFSEALNEKFALAKRIAVTGASTVPALSSAVVEHLCAGWRHIHALDICIAPAQTAPRGVATMRAVLNYCGAPIRVWNNSEWQTQRGWAQPAPVRFARLKPRLGAVCDIPDLELFPSRFQVRDRVMFRAALELLAAQRGFEFLAWLRHLGVLPRPAAWANVLNRGAKCIDSFGSSLGGMVLRASGENDHGQLITRSWHIAADHDHGPEIPCMAAILLTRKLVKGESLAHGAFTSMGLLGLSEFAPEFAKWGMVTDVVEGS